MKYLILSDIHGNLPALEKLIMIERAAIDAYINLGDVVNYAPWSNECVELIDGLENCTNILGNHEDYFLNGKCEVKHPLVSMFFEQCFPEFKFLDKIEKYKSSTEIEGVKFIHTLNNEYVFHDSDVSIDQTSFIGHSHQQYKREIGNFLLLNPGSIGQNRKFINVSNYILWDSDKNTFDLKSFTFDIELVISEMKSKKYPKKCIEYYNKKKRLHA